MYLIPIAIGVLVLSGLASLACGRRAGMSATVGVGGALAGCALAGAAAVTVLAGGTVPDFHVAWSMPVGSVWVAMDALSAWFVLPTALLSALSAIYGEASMRDEQDSPARRSAWLFYNLLAAGMLTVLTARNGMLFLLAWETMALSSFFLVMTEGARDDVRQAGWIYLVATHIGTAFLLVMFLLLGRGGNSLDFDSLAPAGRAGLLFLLAVVGFGTKAGIMPMHVWLPEAHPAAPSHVSAVMSGVMIKTGIYGLLRTLTLLGAPREWWGWLLLGMGAASGILGVLLALAQRDVKRMLAYSSIENIGVLFMGLGLGVLGLARGNGVLAAMGFAGAILHVANHAFFKGLLFLTAGAAAHAAGTRDMDRIGGLIKRMPWTGGAFFAGSAAISALPPLNGFVGEFLIYLGCLHAIASGAATSAGAGLLALGALALIGGLTAACFTRAMGIMFLGQPRTESAASAHESTPSMRVVFGVLVLACLGVGVLARPGLALLAPPVGVAMGVPAAAVTEDLAGAASSLDGILPPAGILVGVLAALAILRRRLLAGRSVEQAGTWDCGYAAPSARMQYTATSFAGPLTGLFRLILRTRRGAGGPGGLFPRQAGLATHTPDLFGEGLYRPAFTWARRIIGGIRWLQHGRIQLYVLYIVVTLLILLIWGLG